MIYIIISIIGLLISKGRGSISRILFLMLFVTSIGTFMVGRQPDFLDISTIMYSLYTGFLLYILFVAFKKYANCTGINEDQIDVKRLMKLDKILRPVALIALIINVYVIFKIFPLLLVEQINVQEFKNEGGAASIIDSYIPHIYITFSNIVSVVGYFYLSMHFYYFTKGNTKQALICLFLSLIIILCRLIALSRSTSVEYIVMYGIIFLYLYPLNKHRIKKKYIIILTSILVIFIGVFSTISQSRFSDYYTKEGEKTSIINEVENPVLFSTFDYLSQWVEYNDVVLSRYQIDNVVLGYYGFSELPMWFIKKLDNKGEFAQRQEKKIKAALGDADTAFCGLVALLTVDFGIIGTLLFILFFSVIIRNLSPGSSKELSVKTLLWLPIFINVVGLFWGGNNFKALNTDLAVIYTFFWISFIKKKTI